MPGNVEFPICPFCGQALSVCGGHKLEISPVDEVVNLHKQLADTEAYYACRFERMRELCELHGLIKEWANIVANGVVGEYEPPNFFVQMNDLRAKIIEQQALIEEFSANLCSRCKKSVQHA